MLDFERQLVATLTTATDPGRRAAVAAFVEGSLDDMPEFLRAGVVAESIAFAGWSRALRVAGNRRGLNSLITTLEASPISLVRQYVRLFRSLILFAEQELAEAQA